MLAHARATGHRPHEPHETIIPKGDKGYRRALVAGTASDALVIIATFAPDGPEKCSGLPVQRHDAASLAAALGSEFKLLDDWREEHLTPWGAAQNFIWCVFRREA